MTQVQPAAPTVRVLLTKSFIDSHDRAIRTVALALRDAGMEVILIDYETAVDIVGVAIDEDVDVIGISFMSGGQVDVTTQVMDELALRGVTDIPVVIGGIIRPFDVTALHDLGVSGIFRGGEKLSAMTDAFEQLAMNRHKPGRGASAIE